MFLYTNLHHFCKIYNKMYLSIITKNTKTRQQVICNIMHQDARAFCHTFKLSNSINTIPAESHYLVSCHVFGLTGSTKGSRTCSLFPISSGFLWLWHKNYMNIITKLNNVYMFKNYIFVYNVYDSLDPTNSKAHQKFYKRKEFQHQNYSVGRAFEMTMHAHVSRIGLHVVQTMSLCYLSLQRSIFFRFSCYFNKYFKPVFKCKLSPYNWKKKKKKPV